MDPKSYFSTQRIRFVWILRDFGKFVPVCTPLKGDSSMVNIAHMQWCASVLYRCQTLVSPESIQLDLFVTNYNPPVPQPLDSKGATDPMPSSTIDTSFSPTSVEVKGIALDETDLIDAQMPEDDYVDLSYYTGDYTENGELGHEEHQLDLTNFDGDNDDRVRGENTLNRAVKKEGTIRRAITRKKKTTRRSKRASELGPLPDLSTILADIDEQPLSPPTRARAGSTTPGDDPVRGRQTAGKSSRLSVQSIVLPTQRASSPAGWDMSGYGEGHMGHAKRMSTASLATQASSMQALMRETMDEPQLELGEQEMRDINVMAEFARPGRPKVDLILRDEVAMANGRIVIACE
jgi:hypothetical protein